MFFKLKFYNFRRIPWNSASSSIIIGRRQQIELDNMINLVHGGPPKMRPLVSVQWWP